MPKIMLVEDDNNLREIYGERLMAEGYEIVSAADGEEALALAVKEKPDLIISDVMMPKISGFDMLDILRQTAETKFTKVIMMTALSQTEDKARADRLGADKYLVKSQVTLEDVARVVHDLIYGPDETTASNTASAGPETATQEPAVTNPTPVVTAPTEAVAPAAAVVASEPVAVVSEPVAQPVVATPNPAVTADPVSAPIVVNDTDEQIVPPATTEQEQLAPQTIAEVSAAVESITNVAPVTNPVIEPTIPTEQLSTPTMPEPVVAPAVESAPVNPISSGDSSYTLPPAGAEDNSASAQSAADETAVITDQINAFANAPVADNQTQPVAPLVEPTEQDLIHAQNAVEDPQVLQPAVVSGVANAPAATVDPTVPPIIEASGDGAPEPAGVRKKVIQPINDTNVEAKPNIYELYEKEMAQEAANTVINPLAAPLQDSSNPLTAANPQDVAAAAPLETVDVSQIQGLAVEGEQPVVPAPVEAATAPPTTQVQEQPTQPVDPNDPSQIAL